MAVSTEYQTDTHDTRLILAEQLADAPPLEDGDPLRRFELLAEDTFDACLPLRVVQALGEDICELGRLGDADEQDLSMLNDLVGEVLPDVDVLGSLPSADDVVTPLDVRRIVRTGVGDAWTNPLRSRSLRRCRTSLPADETA